MAIPIGINFADVKDWSSELVFVDVMKMAREWVSSDADKSGSWDTGHAYEIRYDEDGYPLEIPYPLAGKPAQKVKTILFTGGAKSHHPVGTYTLFYDGEGDISVSGAAKIISRTTNSTGGKYLIDVSTDGSIILTIDRSVRGNHIRNIRFIMPGYENTYEAQIFYPQFLNRYENVSVVRFMNFGNINDNPLVRWENRPRTTDYVQTSSRGVSAEYMLMLANTMDIDPWFTIPHMADDEYVRNFARLVRDGLKKDKTVYIEYSNELWNGGFKGTGWVRTKGCQDPDAFVLHSGGNDWGVSGCDDGASGFRFQAKRSARIFEIFRDEFGNESGRIVNAIASQAANRGVSTALFAAFDDPAINPTGIRPDALAIAPYFGGGVADQIANTGEIGQVSVDTILDRAERDIDTNVRDWIVKQKQVADVEGVALIAYEGGQHLVGTRGNQDNDKLTSLLHAANRHPRMYDLYVKYLDAWYGSGGGPLVLFNSVYSPNKWGSWGHLEYQDQPDNTAPKYRAILDRIDLLQKNVLLTQPAFGANEDKETPTNFTIAFIGDQGLWDSSKAVLALIKGEGADLVLHQGDLDYRDDPALWDAQTNTILGDDFPQLAVIGNHDTKQIEGYQKLMNDRIARIPGLLCTGELGVKATCTYKGIQILQSGVGSYGVFDESYFTTQLSEPGFTWRICSWHTPERHGQDIRKAYEACRKAGAIIVTGHIHSYSRTGLVSDFDSKKMRFTNETPLVIEKGKTVMAITGLGGGTLRHKTEKDFRDSIQYANDYIIDYAENFGALFCKFNENGITNRAHCYFKTIDGEIIDQFDIVSTA